MAGVRSNRHPAVPESRRPPHCRETFSPNPDRRSPSLRRLRQQRDVLELDKLSREVWSVTRPELAEDLHVFIDELSPVLKGRVQSPELLLHPPDPQTHDQP